MPAAPTTAIESHSSIFPSLKEIWQFRGFIVALVRRTLKVRYKYTTLGVGWLVITPLLSASIFTFFFSKLAKVSTGDVPYPVFVLSGLLMWNFFSSSLIRAADSLIDFAKMLTKVYIPRLCFPIASLIGSVVDFVVSLGSFMILAIAYGYYPSYTVLATPLFLLLAFLIALGLGILLSVLHVLYRDVRQITPFVLQLWMYLSPVAYPTTLVPNKWRDIYALNPMVGVIEGIRWSLTGKGEPLNYLPYSIAFLIVSLLTGLLVFHKYESKIADVI